VYSPTGTEGAENRPSASVVNVRLAPVSTCRTTTVAPESGRHWRREPCRWCCRLQPAPAPRERRRKTV